MAIQEVKTTINDAEYFVTSHPGRSGLALQFKLIKLLSPLLLAAFGDEKKLEIGLKNSIISLPEKEFEELVIKSIFAHTKRDGKSLDGADFDLAFSSNYAELYEAIFFVLKFNFGSLEDLLKKNTGLKELFLAAQQTDQ